MFSKVKNKIAAAISTLAAEAGRMGRTAGSGIALAAMVALFGAATAEANWTVNGTQVSHADGWVLNTTLSGTSRTITGVHSSPATATRLDLSTPISDGSVFVSIGNSTFQSSAIRINSVVLPSTLMSMGNNIFHGCTFTNFVWNGAMKGQTIAQTTFQNVKFNCDLFIDGPSAIGDNAFYNSDTTRITGSLILGNSVTSIGNNAFKGNSGIKSLTFGNGVTSIGNDVFVGNTGINSVVLPSTLTSMGNNIFHGCTFTNFVWNGAMKGQTIAQTTFQNVKFNCDLFIDGPSAIGDNAFYNSTTTKITGSLVLGNSVTSIGNSAFLGNTGINSVVLSSNLTTMGLNIFHGCTFTDFVWNGAMKGQTIVQTTFQNVKFNCVLFIDGPAAIGQNAFYNGDTTRINGSLILGNSVMSIGQQAFYRNTGLVRVSTPSTDVTFGAYAFTDNSGLQAIYFRGDYPQSAAAIYNNPATSGNVTSYVATNQVANWDSKKEGTFGGVWGINTEQATWRARPIRCGEWDVGPFTNYTYTVHYAAGLGTGTPMPSETFYRNVGRNLSRSAYTRPGYVQTGWTAANGAFYGNFANVANLAAVGGSVTLTAVWERYTPPNTVEVTFDYNDGVTSDSTADVAFGAQYGTCFPTAPTRAGYSFGGWARNGTIVNAADIVVVGDTAHTLTAQWTANAYTVRFNANSGTGTMTDQSFAYGTAQVLAANAFTRTGYAFGGWNTQADGGGTAYAAGASVNNLTATQNGTVNLYAQWSYATGQVPPGGSVTLNDPVLPGDTTLGTYTPGEAGLDLTDIPVTIVIKDGDGNTVGTLTGTLDADGTINLDPVFPGLGAGDYTVDITVGVNDVIEDTITVGVPPANPAYPRDNGNGTVTVAGLDGIFDTDDDLTLDPAITGNDAGGYFDLPGGVTVLGGVTNLTGPVYIDGSDPHATLPIGPGSLVTYNGIIVPGENWFPNDDGTGRFTVYGPSKIYAYVPHARLILDLPNWDDEAVIDPSVPSVSFGDPETTILIPSGVHIDDNDTPSNPDDDIVIFPGGDRSYDTKDDNVTIWPVNIKEDLDADNNVIVREGDDVTVVYGTNQPPTSITVQGPAVILYPDGTVIKNNGGDGEVPTVKDDGTVEVDIGDTIIHPDDPGKPFIVPPLPGDPGPYTYDPTVPGVIGGVPPVTVIVPTGERIHDPDYPRDNGNGTVTVAGLDGVFDTDDDLTLDPAITGNDADGYFQIPNTPTYPTVLGGVTNLTGPVYIDGTTTTLAIPRRSLVTYNGIIVPGNVWEPNGDGTFTVTGPAEIYAYVPHARLILALGPSEEAEIDPRVPSVSYGDDPKITILIPSEVIIDDGGTPDDPSDDSVTVPGPDGKPNTPDDVMIKPAGTNDVNPETGIVTVPGPDGSVISTNGVPIIIDGITDGDDEFPEGTLVLPDGTIIVPSNPPNPNTPREEEDGTIIVGPGDTIILPPYDDPYVVPTIPGDDDGEYEFDPTVPGVKGGDPEIVVTVPGDVIIIPTDPEIPGTGKIIVPGKNGATNDVDDIVIDDGTYIKGGYVRVNDGSPVTGGNEGVDLGILVPGGSLIHPDGFVLIGDGLTVKADGTVDIPAGGKVYRYDPPMTLVSEGPGTFDPENPPVPAGEAAVPVITAITMTGPGTLSITVSNCVTRSATYQLQSAADLSASPSFSDVSGFTRTREAIAADGVWIITDVPATEAKRFFRIRAGNP